MSTPRKSSRQAAARGAITWVGLVLLVGILGGAYLAWTWVPVYVVHLEVKQVVRDIGNRAVRNPDDQELLAELVSRVRGLESVRTVDPEGRSVTVPVVDLRPEAITWERQPPDALHVAFDYERQVPLPLLDRSLQRVMSVDLTLDISRARWDSR